MTCVITPNGDFPLTRFLGGEQSPITKSTNGKREQDKGSRLLPATLATDVAK